MFELESGEERGRFESSAGAEGIERVASILFEQSGRLRVLADVEGEVEGAVLSC